MKTASKQGSKPNGCFRFLNGVFTFLILFLIGLFYAFLVSAQYSFEGLGEELQLFHYKVLVLIFSGILGGVIDSVLIDRNIELPWYDAQKQAIVSGVIGDALVGIGGAFIIGFLASGYESIQSDDPPYTSLAAVGILGGFASKKLMEVALNRVLERIQRAEHDKESLAQLVEQIIKQIKGNLSDLELLELKNQIQQSPPELRQPVFSLVREFRRLCWQAGDVQAEGRTIPIFEALVTSDEYNYHYHTQLAIARIHKHDWQLGEVILDNLLTINRYYRLDQMIAEASDREVSETLTNWLIENQEWIRAQSNDGSLLNLLDKLSTTDPVGQENGSSPPTRDSNLEAIVSTLPQDEVE